jgi:PAS domain S-box-containing protein
MKKVGAGKAEDALRRRAEARLIAQQKSGGEKAGARMTTADALRFAQELQIHQIELELQNEELKQARNEAEAERERYLDLYDFAPMGYFTLDGDGIISRVNLTGARVVGVERSRLLNRRFGQFISPDYLPAFDAFLKRVFEKRRKESCTISLGEAERQRSYVHIEATVTGNGQECLVVVLDVTEQKKAGDELRKLREELEQLVTERTARLEAANQELEAFCYSVSHDLQTPLRAIDGYSRKIMQRQGEQFDAETRNQFTIIRGSILKMGQLISDLLAFSRLRRKKLSIVAWDMETVVKEAWKELKAANPGQSMTLRMEGLPQVTGDRELIKQVVANILANAVKFSKFRENVIVEVGGHVKGTENIYTIKDNGIGFDMAYYDKVFGMFQQLHNPDEYEGTGIGLAIGQRIINRHGGRIWAESEVGKGATFYFSLPTVQE